MRTPISPWPNSIFSIFTYNYLQQIAYGPFLCFISKNTEKSGIVNSRDKTENSLSSFCTVFGVYVAFRFAVLIEMHIYSSSNLKNYFEFGGTCPLCPYGSAPARAQRYLASMFC